VSASRSGRKLALATTLTGLVAAPLAVIATAAPASAVPTPIQILGTNDFHGRLLPNTSSGAQEAGAAQLAGAVQQLEAGFAGPTVFAAGGDLIGASTFESFIQRDKPTIDALNAAGLDVSAAGNHEPEGRSSVEGHAIVGTPSALARIKGVWSPGFGSRDRMILPGQPHWGAFA
jgi:5'-nucleotidase